MQQGVLHGGVRLTGAGVHGQTRGLVDHHQVLVAVDDLQWQRLRPDLLLRLGLGLQLQPVSDHHLHPRARRRLAIELQMAIGYPLLEAFAGIVAKKIRRHAIQALATQLGGHLHLNRLPVAIGYTRRALIIHRVVPESMSLRFSAALMLATTLLLGACASNPDGIAPDNPFRSQKSQRELRYEADQLYRVARRKLDSADFSGAILDYSSLKARYPFSDFATQAQLELIYAHYRNFQPDQALTEADRFLRDHPRHEQIAYVNYLKGMIYFQRGTGFLDSLPFVDPTRQDVGDARRAFDAFSLLTSRFPDSPYVGDARQRMIYLRNRIASHELHVVRYYVKRGAYVAAARRAEQIISGYPGAPAAFEALQLAASSYRELGLDDQAAAADKLIAANRAQVDAALQSTTPEPEPGLLQRWFGDEDEGSDS